MNGHDETSSRAAIGCPITALGEIRERVVVDRRNGLIGVETVGRILPVVVSWGSVVDAAEEWSEMGMDHIGGHPNRVPKPVGD